jgi:FkbM family methyltransferase
MVCNDYELENDEIFEIGTKREFGNEKGKLVIQPLGIIVIEFLEQYLTNKWITKDDIVLEFGSRLGIVSLTINSRLAKKNNHVVIEPNKTVIPALEFNKKAFGAKFHICTEVISNKSLKYVITDNQLGNYTVENININDENNQHPDLINTISYDEFIKKYNLNFNVLVADCEGCLEQFFCENEQILDQLDLILFEKDNIDRCNYGNIFELFRKHNFVFRDGLINNTNNYENYFQQVWSK